MITTKTGDKGETQIGNRRIKKAACLIDTLGCLDSLSSAIGLARTHCADVDIDEACKSIQFDLYLIMGNIHIKETKLPTVNYLDEKIKQYENKEYMKDFHIAGSSRSSAFFDFARTECREAERILWKAYERKEYASDETLVFLNRLSDLLWLFARYLGDKEDTVTQYENKESI